MQIELNKHEIKFLSDALDAWERDQSMRSVANKLFGKMANGEELLKDEIVNSLKDEENKAYERQIKTTLLRAKLFQAIARDSEHEITSEESVS